MNLCNFCDCLKQRKQLKNRSFWKSYMIFCVSKSDGGSSLYIYVLHQQRIFQTHQKVLLIQCLWQYNKKVREKSLQSLISSISASTVGFYRKFHNMIYYINYSHVGFMLLSLKREPHSKIDLRIYFGRDESAPYCD